MHLTFRNVNDAFTGLIGMFHTKEFGPGSDWRRHGDAFPVVRRPSRNGAVLVIDEPVTITYTHPTERVLLNPARDANPFFHLYEALWMLAGRNDVAPLRYYNSRIGDYSDDGRTLNGAYGYRWRHALMLTEAHHYDVDNRGDQLDILVSHLKADPNSRRAVLQMWNVEDDLLKIGRPEICSYCCGEGVIKPGPLSAQCVACEGKGYYTADTSKDVCCNLSVMFSLRSDLSGVEGMEYKWLDMTVTNRSNDLVWGCLGGDYVCFSFLQEYLAARLGVGVGRYHHFSNNLHAYVERPDWDPQGWLAAAQTERSGPRVDRTVVQLVRNPEVFERELPEFVEYNSGSGSRPPRPWQEPFFDLVAQPALGAYRVRREERDDERGFGLDRLADTDWLAACQGWIDRRAAGRPR